MAAKICTIKINTEGYSRFIALPNWLSPKDSYVTSERNGLYHFSTKRSAQVFAKRLKMQLKNRGYKFTIEIDDLPF